MARRDDREPGPPPRVVCAAGWQYREYLTEEQRSQRRGPQRGSRVGVAWGCIARRMQPDFHHGLVGFLHPIFSRTRPASSRQSGPS